MANLTETATYEAGIYRFETTDPVQGGPGGIDNLPTNQLANRTAWLKSQVEAILLDIAAIESGYATDAELATHTGNTSNPHAVTKAQVGLASVLNYGVATQAEAEAGTVDTKYMTPLRAKQLLLAMEPASLAVSGYQRLASGLIIMWGAMPAIAAGESAVITQPIALPNGRFFISAQTTVAFNSTSPIVYAVDPGPGGNQFTVRNRSINQGGDSWWFSVGY